MQVSGPYNDAVTLTGTAATNKTVTFNNNGGSGTMSNQVSAFAANLNANTFTRAGYTFHYWTLFSEGSGSTFSDQASYPFSSNQTLFAQWTADSHTVTFNTDGGSAVANGSFNTDGSRSTHKKWIHLQRLVHFTNWWHGIELALLPQWHIQHHSVCTVEC